MYSRHARKAMGIPSVKTIRHGSRGRDERTSLTTRSCVLTVNPFSSWCCVKSISGAGRLPWISLIARSSWDFPAMALKVERGRLSTGREVKVRK